MYARRLKCRNKKWDLVFQPRNCQISSSYRDMGHVQPSYRTNVAVSYGSQSSFIRQCFPDFFSAGGAANGSRGTGLHYGSKARWKSIRLRSYSSEGDGRNASEDKHALTKDGSDFDKGKAGREGVKEDVRHSDVHARLGDQDQKEWLNNEKLAIESKKKESPFLSRREKFKNDFMRRVVPWDKITVSWETFPYYIHEHTKKNLVECAASHLKHKKFAAAFGGRLTSSSGRILLQSGSGTELYRERLVRALARDLEVPLLVLDSNVFAPYDFGEDCSSECEDEDAESGEDCSSESEVEDENGASKEEECTSSSDSKTDCSDDEVDVQASAEALTKLVSFNLEDFENQRVPEESESSSGSSQLEASEPVDKSKQPLKKGDRIKYIGPQVYVEADNRFLVNVLLEQFSVKLLDLHFKKIIATDKHLIGKGIILGKIPTSSGSANAYTIIRGRDLSTGQRGMVYEVNGEQAAVIWDTKENKEDKGEINEKSVPPAKQSVFWIQAKYIEHDLDTQADDSYAAIEALCEVLHLVKPLIVYFPDSQLWLSRAVSKSNRKEFAHNVEKMFDESSEPVVLICGHNKVETGSKEKDNFTMILPSLGRLSKLPLPLKQLTEGLKATKGPDDNEIVKLFPNILTLYPPKDEDLLRAFNKQIEEDRKIVISRSNLHELHKVLEEHELLCTDLLHVNSDGVILTKQKAEKVVGWAKNHYLSNCLLPSIKGDRLTLPRESLEIAILRLREQETVSKKPSQNLKNLAKDEYETNFVSSVVPPGEIGVKFDDIGALEDVKRALNELVILPMRRPELFSYGNLLRPCKGILLFGPPGTGKTLLAKALATEAGANFISITGSTLTSKWFGDAEKLTKALFSFASKLAPVIIFVDEVDSLLGARGGAFEHEATRRMRNEFMAAWDGLRTKDNQKILILGATNRPFDLDDAVIRRLPRRIYVDLPDAVNRLKILKIFLALEKLEPEFQFEDLAQATEGYSGSDLKNLCIAAAYKPVQELLEEEKKSGQNDVVSALRALKLDDFIQSKAKVGPSVAYDATSMNELRKWNDQYGEGGSRTKSPFGF